MSWDLAGAFLGGVQAAQNKQALAERMAGARADTERENKKMELAEDQAWLAEHRWISDTQEDAEIREAAKKEGAAIRSQGIAEALAGRKLTEEIADQAAAAKGIPPLAMFRSAEAPYSPGLTPAAGNLYPKGYAQEQIGQFRERVASEQTAIQARKEAEVASERYKIPGADQPKPSWLGRLTGLSDVNESITASIAKLRGRMADGTPTGAPTTAVSMNSDPTIHVYPNGQVAKWDGTEWKRIK